MGISPIYPPKVARYIYDNEDILLELDGSDNITARYTHGPGIDEPLIMEKNSQSFYYHADGLGSVTEITDAAGAVKQQYVYSSFGKIESQLDSSFVQPYTFTAREFDSETELYHYRARQYDSKSGRFNQEDPILHAGNPDIPFSAPVLLSNPPMLHPYTYTQNNPVGSTDPLGLISCNGRWVQVGWDRLFNISCLCYWLCVPCDGPTIWGGNPRTLPSTVGVLTGANAIKRGDNCLCFQQPGPQTGCCNKNQ